MGAINQDWYAGNATRAYPLDDAATARDDAGLELPPQILVDCRLRFPRGLGKYAYVGGVTVSPGLVAVVLMASTPAARPPGGLPPVGGGFTALGSVTLPRPVQPNRHYPIEPMAAGVGGWLVFGRGIDEPYAGRFSSPAQSMLLPRVASSYLPLPIPSLGKLGLEDSLEGVVQLLGGTDMEVIQDVREIDGGDVDAIIIRLVDSLNRNVFDLYKGPCGGRPESRNCDAPALESINAVEPDCNGNLNIDFRGVAVSPFAGGGGIALDMAMGMSDICLGQDYLPDENGNLPGMYDGDCEPPPPGPGEPGGPPIEPGPGEPGGPPIDPDRPPGYVPPIPEGCTALPAYDSFDAGISDAWVVKVGNYLIENDDSPGEPFTLEGPDSGVPAPGHTPAFQGLPPMHRAARNTGAPDFAPLNRSYAAVDQSQRNISIWDCDYDYSKGDYTITTHVKLMPGPQSNGGIIFDYNEVNPLNPGHAAYHLLMINAMTGFVEWHFNGGMGLYRYAWWPLGAVLKIGDWYSVKIRTRPHPTQHGAWGFAFWVGGVTDPSFPQQSTAGYQAFSGPFAPGGKFGLGTSNAHCLFSFFQLEQNTS